MLKRKKKLSIRSFTKDRGKFWIREFWNPLPSPDGGRGLEEGVGGGGLKFMFPESAKIDNKVGSDP